MSGATSFGVSSPIFSKLILFETPFSEEFWLSVVFLGKFILFSHLCLGYHCHVNGFYIKLYVCTYLQGPDSLPWSKMEGQLVTESRVVDAVPLTRGMGGGAVGWNRFATRHARLPAMSQLQRTDPACSRFTAVCRSRALRGAPGRRPSSDRAAPGDASADSVRTPTLAWLRSAASLPCLPCRDA